MWLFSIPHFQMPKVKKDEKSTCKSNPPSKSVPPVILLWYCQLPWCNFNIVRRPDFMEYPHSATRGAHTADLQRYKICYFTQATLPGKGGNDWLVRSSGHSLTDPGCHWNTWDCAKDLWDNCASPETLSVSSLGQRDDLPILFLTN